MLPIRARLTAWYALFLVGTLIALGAFLVLKLRSDLRATIDHEVRISSSAIRQGYLNHGARGFREITAATLQRTGTEAQVLDGRGRVLISYGGDVAQDPMVAGSQLTRALGSAPGLSSTRLGDAQQPFRVQMTPVGTGGRRQLLVVAGSLRGANEAVRKILILLLIAGPITLAVAALAGWLLVRNALAPVDRMRAKAESIGIDNLDERLSAANRSDEIGQLARTLNAMLDRLQAGVLARRQLIADASHELRTPLAAMRAELDVGIRDRSRGETERAALSSVREDVDRMSRTVDNLLTLALADSGQLELLRSEIDLQQVVRGAVKPLRALAAAKGVEMSVSGAAGSVEADAERMHQVVTNLVENAIKYTPRGGEVGVTVWQRDGEVGVTVSDNGVGIPAAAQEQVFRRFFRADGSRSRESGGSGLGLAICREIALAHGGRISVQSQEGAGSSFSVVLAGPAGSPVQRPGR